MGRWRDEGMMGWGDARGGGLREWGDEGVGRWRDGGMRGWERGGWGEGGMG